ncbi:MAG: cyclic nucleotide-binding domain-containing protein [Proteobacteria bacterium]|nr:cyclic nucleotide-binding domain-containing protein [Pseudomonadota bacterium]
MTGCETCRLAEFCFPPGLEKAHVHLLDKLINKQKIFHKSDYLFKAGASFKNIVVIRSGSIKTYKINAQGDQLITGFCYPGEVLGLNAIATKCYQENAVALDTVSVCELSFCEFEKVAEQVPSFQRQLIKMMSEKLCHTGIINLSSSAESKMAFFLLSISQKMKNYGTSGLDFKLSMTREDIAKYLGLASETVSRVLSKFQLSNLVACSQKNVQLKAYDQLVSLAEHVG